jgi:hypothetical protein
MPDQYTLPSFAIAALAFFSRVRIYILLVSSECGGPDGLDEILRMVEDPVVQCACVHLLCM